MRKKCPYYAVYTAVFCILFVFCFLLFLIAYHKTFFRNWDGYDQHYISFLYLGRWVRGIFRNLFIHHRLSVQLWNPAIGYGADVLTSLSAYLWDPFNWISVLIPARFAEYGYAVMIILKFYACGAAYSFFALRRNHSEFAVLCGAVIYTFSAVGYVGFYQSFFLNPLILFPLLIRGVDLLYEQGKAKLYVAVLAASFASYLYFAYMMSLLVAGYAVIRVLFDADIRRDFGAIGRMILRFLLYAVLAAGISAVSFIPSFLVLSQVGKIGLSYHIPLLFHKSFYGGLFTGFTTRFNMLHRDCYAGWGAVALVCVILLFFFRGEYRRIKTEFILLSAGLCIPFFGHMMNGFGYTANRWVWAYSLLVSYIVTLMAPRLYDLSMIQKIALTIAAVVYILISRGYFQAEGTEMEAAGMLILLTVLLCFAFPQISKKQYEMVMMTLCGLSVICLSFFVHSRDYGNEFGDHIEAGTAYQRMLESGGLPLLNEIDRAQGSRFDRYELGQVKNASWLYGASGINFYISMYSNRVDHFHTGLDLNTGSPTCNDYRGLNRRSELEALLAVDHYFTDADHISKPVGFSLPEAERMIGLVKARSYKADQKNQLFYTFKRTVSRDAFETLGAYEKQQALMQACVLEDAQTNTRIGQLSISSDSVPFGMAASEGVMIDGNAIHVDLPETYLDLTFAPQKDAEIYLSFEKLEYENGEDTSYSFDVQGFDNETLIENMKDTHKGLTPYSHIYGAKLNRILNLGVAEQALNRIRITFHKAGSYTFDAMHLYARPAAKIEEAIEGLERLPENIRVSGNRISCRVRLKEPRILFASIPWSAGWKAYDNGKRISILPADTAFMGLKLEEGDHTIVFRYRTPGLYEGLAVSISSLLLLFLCRRLPFRKLKDAV